MKYLQRYKQIQLENPNLAPYPCLVKTLKGKNASRFDIVELFEKCMEKEEFDEVAKIELIDYLAN